MFSPLPTKPKNPIQMGKKIEKINYMSGSLRVYAQKNYAKINNVKTKGSNIKKIILFEKRMKIVKNKIIIQNKI